MRPARTLRFLKHRIRRFLAHKYPTKFGIVRVYTMPQQGRPLRILDLEGTQQSGTYLDDDWCDVPFLYMAMYDLVFRANPPAHDVLMLGGGGFAYPKHVIAHHPKARIDVVEVDPAIVAIARKHFFLDRLIEQYHTEETGRLRIFEDDALSYLVTCAHAGRRYDAILNDCFVTDNPVLSLATAEAARTVRTCLAPEGLFVVNLITSLVGENAEPLNMLVASLSQVFNYVLALPCFRRPADQRDNVLVVASQANPKLDDAIVLFEAVS